MKENNNSANRPRTKTLAMIGLMAALICILGPLTIPLPFSPVPLSLTHLPIFFSIYLLGMKKGTVSYLIYMLLGLVGLPVFSGFSGGPGKLFGPTGGYIIGFVFMAIICGLFIDRWFDKWYLCLAGMLLGCTVCYLFGTVWLAYQSKLSFSVALMSGVIPFIPGDLIKILITLPLGSALRKAVFRTHLLD